VHFKKAKNILPKLRGKYWNLIWLINSLISQPYSFPLRISSHTFFKILE
jgi:hypothetical protein